MIIKGNTVGTPMPRANWEQTDSAKADYIRGKETVEQAIAAAKSCAEEAKTAAAEAKTEARIHADSQENPHGVTPSQIGAQVQHWNAAITLPAANWAGGSQSVVLPEMGGDDTVISTPAPESCDLYVQSGVRLSAQSAGMLTYTCENAPREDLRMVITCFGAAGSAGSGGSGGDSGSGKDGISPVAQVTQTADGAEISITDATGTTKATVCNGKDGEKGEAGYTPQREIDYWTPADQEAIVQQVLTVMGMHIVGQVQPSNKLIIFRGELPDGTYTSVYEKADGTLVPVGIFEHSDADAEIVNLIAESIDVDGTPYNNGIGYQIGYRYSNTDYSLKADAGYSVTGFIPIENGNIKNVYHLENIYHNDTDNPCITLYDENFNMIIRDGTYPTYKASIKSIQDIIGTELEFGCAMDGAQLLSFTVYSLKYWFTRELVDQAKYFRIVSAGTMDDSCKVIFNSETI